MKKVFVVGAIILFMAIIGGAGYKLAETAKDLSATKAALIETQKERGDLRVKIDQLEAVNLGRYYETAALAAGLAFLTFPGDTIQVDHEFWGPTIINREEGGLVSILNKAESISYSSSWNVFALGVTMTKR